MSNKIAIQLKKIPKTKYAFQKLKLCKKCGTYTSLPDSCCMQCYHTDKFIRVSDFNTTTTKFRFQIMWLFPLSLLFLAFILCNNLTQIALTFLSLAVLTVLMKFLMAKYYQSEIASNLRGLFRKYHNEIRWGLDTDTNISRGDMDSSKYKEAYEKLRYISTLLLDDDKKVMRLVCLDNFILRKDMDLDVDSLILSEYNIGLVNYIYEVSKVNRSLVKSKAFDYIIRFEEEILQLENAYEILGSIAGAVLKSNQHLTSYKDFVLRYLKYLKRERMLRLCTLIKTHYVDDWEELKKESSRIVGEVYYGDPDFKGFIA